MKLFISFFFLVIHLQLFAQAPLTPVIITEDSWSTWINRIETAAQYVEMVRQGTMMIENQIRVFESLSQGDLDGLVQAFNYQTNVVTGFANNLEQFTRMQATVDENGNVIFPDGAEDNIAMARSLANSFQATNQLMSAVGRTAESTRYRSQQLQILNQLSATNTSPAAQMQIMNQGLALLQGQMGDTTMILQAMNNAELENRNRQEFLRQRREEEVQNFYFQPGSQGSTPMFSDNELDRLLDFSEMDRSFR